MQQKKKSTDEGKNNDARQRGKQHRERGINDNNLRIANKKDRQTALPNPQRRLYFCPTPALGRTRIRENAQIMSSEKVKSEKQEKGARRQRTRSIHPSNPRERVYSAVVSKECTRVPLI